MSVSSRIWSMRRSWLKRTMTRSRDCGSLHDGDCEGTSKADQPGNACSLFAIEKVAGGTAEDVDLL